MRSRVLCFVVAACSAPTTKLPERPVSATERFDRAERHVAKAEQHEQIAERAERSGGTLVCSDPVLDDQLTSGTEPLTTWSPCWDIEIDTEVRHRRAAERERRAARRDRQIAADLIRAQRARCEGVPAADLERSPFARRDAIIQVEPHETDDEVRGALIVIRPAPGLTADGIRKAVECHQARFAALGKPTTYLAEDPTVVEGAHVQVREGDGRIEVLVVSDAPGAGHIVLGRAQDLLGEQTARR
jgi:hypothetical protein